MSIQMILGFFPFTISTAAYEELTHTSGYEWAEQKPIGSSPILQYVGPTAETISLRGKLMPPITGGPVQLRRLRALAELGTPLVLISGTGLVLGRWVIEEISDTGRHHASNGVPRLDEFSIRLKKADDGLSKLTKFLSSASKFVGLVK
jgi:uncharacterized protein